MENGRPSENFGKLRAISANRGRSSAISSSAMPPSSTRPIGAARKVSVARSAAHRALETITGPTPRSPRSPARCQGSRRKAPSFHSGPLASTAPDRFKPSPGPTVPSLAAAPGWAGAAEAAPAANGVAATAAAALATRVKAAAGRGSSGGIEGLFEGVHAQTGVGGQKRLLGAGPQFQVGVDHLLDGIDDAVGTKARAGDAGQGRVLAAGATEQQLVVFLASLFDAEDADGTDVVVAAGVDAAGDFDLEVTHLLLPRRQPFGDALGDGDRARVGERTVVEAGAGDDVGGEAGVGFGEPNRLQLLIDRPQIAEPDVRQHQVLFVANAHLIEREA